MGRMMGIEKGKGAVCTIHAPLKGEPLDNGDEVHRRLESKRTHESTGNERVPCLQSHSGQLTA